MTIYTLQACENLISKYIDEFGGSVSIVEEGVLGLGTVMLHSAEGKKTIIIREVYLNEWSSGHTIRMYKKMPKKYEKYQY
jgi:hypothetical protein